MKSHILAVVALLAFATKPCSAAGDAGNCAPASANSFLQLHLKVESRELKPNPWPQKNGDSLRTGHSELIAGTNLRKAAWVYNEPGNSVIYASPVLDGFGNVVLTSTNGSVFSLRVKDGSPNWMVSIGSAQPAVPTPILIGDALYTTNGMGALYCISLSDGAERWHRQLTDASSGGDAFSMGGSGNILLFASTRSGDSYMGGSGSRLLAFNIVENRTLWEFKFIEEPFNSLPAVLGGQVFIASKMGGLTCLDLDTGTKIWHQEGFAAPAFTTGGMAIGPNGLIYVTGNSDRGCLNVLESNPSNCGDGHLRAWDKAGRLQWNRTFSNVPSNNAPSVYPLASGGYAVTIGLGRNPPSPASSDWDFLMPARDSPDQVVAFNATTGESLWAFDAPVWSSQFGAGSTGNKVCWPDTWSNALIDGAGTLYIGWLGGEVFAISGDTGAFIGSYNTTSSIQGAPGLDSGVLVVASCNNVAAFFA